MFSAPPSGSGQTKQHVLRLDRSGQPVVGDPLAIPAQSPFRIVVASNDPGMTGELLPGTTLAARRRSRSIGSAGPTAATVSLRRRPRTAQRSPVSKPLRTIHLTRCGALLADR